jgi:hypothetical protein
VWDEFHKLPPVQTGYCAIRDDPCQLSTSENSNVLEAINLSLQKLENHRIERELALTGHSLLVITAGNGKYNADRKLTKIAKERTLLLGNNIALISLVRPPLHRVPLMVYRDSEGVKQPQRETVRERFGTGADFEI